MMGDRDDDLDLEAELMAAMGDSEALASSKLQDIPLTSNAGLGLEADDEIGLETRKAAQQQIDKELGLTSGKALVEREDAKAAVLAKRKRAESGDEDEGEEGGKKSRKKKKNKDEGDKKVRFDGESGDEAAHKKRRSSSKKKKSTEEPKQDKEKPSQESKRHRERDRERERERERDEDQQDDEDERMGVGLGGVTRKDQQEDDRDDDLLNELLSGTDEQMLCMDAEAGQQRIKSLISSFTPAQRARYEAYRSASFQPGSMKRVLTSVCGINRMAATAPLVVATCAKLFVGQLIEQSRQISLDWGHSGPLRPVHIREAYRRQQQQHVTSTTLPINRVMRKQLFKHR